MLGYLDALITALTLRDVPEATRLLNHPLARLLPAEVCDEAGAILSGERDALAVPLRAMQVRRQTAELLHEAPALADAPTPAAEASPVHADAPESALDGPRTMPPMRPTRRTRLPQQMELPISA